MASKLSGVKVDLKKNWRKYGGYVWLGAAGVGATLVVVNGVQSLRWGDPRSQKTASGADVADVPDTVTRDALRGMYMASNVVAKSREFGEIVSMATEMFRLEELLMASETPQADGVRIKELFSGIRTRTVKIRERMVEADASPGALREYDDNVHLMIGDPINEGSLAMCWSNAQHSLNDRIMDRLGL
jgi:hypothetical protein